MKRIFLIVTWIGLYQTALAQKSTNNAASAADQSGLRLLLGPAVYYYQGNPNAAIDDFSNNQVGYQLNGFIGYQSTRANGNNLVGVFGTAGYTSESVFNFLTDYQGITTDELVINKFFTFYQVEVGFIIGKALRLSTGVGEQNFTTVNGEGAFRYLSST
ncbi:MAG: hypothetical protein N2044_12855, partial [Cyclobacteriaceae bacterium]|nr:hypothetical protein [Cyclobacteriaceae bacterium]